MASSTATFPEVDAYDAPMGRGGVADLNCNADRQHPSGAQHLVEEAADGVATDPFPAQKARDQQAAGVVRVAYADIVISVAGLLRGEDPVGDHQNFDEGV